MSVITEKLKLLPESPGVYVMLDKDKTVIYVGKAKVLKNRVRQYFHSSAKPYKVQAMVENIADFYYIVVPSEVDALALENNLIKKYKPKYNILLKDDKTYPYIKVHTCEEFPHISVTRKLRRDGSRYFGPFMGGIRCKDIIEVAESVYHVRSCAVSVGEKEKKPCLNYHLHRCDAPCAHLCTREEYMVGVEKTLAFLGGDYKEAEEILREKMMKFAEAEEFELAMDYREKLAMLDKLNLRRITAMPRGVEADVWAFESNGIYACASVLITRGGMMQGSACFPLEEGAAERKEAFLSCLIQYYSNHQFPHELIMDEETDDELLLAYAKQKSDRALVVTRPKMGVKRELADMAARNAREYLEKSIVAIEHKNDMTKNACKRLQEVLSLRAYPKRMECYDISNISGVDKVASMVVFTDGEADKYAYRRFKIKTVEGADDFASLQEVLRRRLAKLGTEEEERFPKPQLIVIDGGKGQLSSVREIFDEMGISDIDLCSLAKQEEEVFTLHSSESVRMDRRDYALQVLQRIRDESHRFAITYFRSLHSKRSLESVLEEIEGVGKKKRLALMKKFGTIDKIRKATTEELCAAEGIGRELAERIKKYFEENLK